MLGGRFKETTDLAAAGKMLTQRPHHDDADVLLGIERLEGGAQLLTLRHRDDVERRPVEDHIGTLTLGVDLNAETVKRIGHYRVGHTHHSVRYSPATRRRRKILPTGDFGMSTTKT
jgi:hypothetical protein